MKVLLLSVAILLSYFVHYSSPIKLDGYFSCQGSLLETGDALACYAATQRECQHGEVILAFEKRQRKRGDKALFQIVDTVHVTAITPTSCVTITTCTSTTGKAQQYFVLFDRTTTSGQQYLRNIKHVWGVNAQDRLVEVPIKTIKCLDGDFGAD